MINMKRFHAFFLMSILLAACTVWGHATTVLMYGPSAPARFTDTLKQAGFTVVQGTSTPQADCDIICVVLPYGRDSGDRRAIATAIDKAVQSGKTLIISGVATGDQFRDYDAFLPVNTWSLNSASGSLVRGGTGIIVTGQSPFKGKFDASALYVSARSDVHLPFAAIESGEHRYQWEKMDKGLLNTDWQVHLTCDTDGQLPLLVSGRDGAGTIFVFGANLYDPQLVASSSYTQFIQSLFTLATPQQTNTPSTLPTAGLSIRIPRYQDHGLSVTVTNDTATPVNALLCYKVSNAEHALLNSTSKSISMPAHGNITVPLEERNSSLGASTIAASSDRAMPYRYITAGLAPLDRSTLTAQASALVDITPRITVTINGENILSAPGMNVGAEDQLGMCGRPAYRYIYNTGDKPRMTVVVRNAMHNIAPLAQATDQNWPENPSTQGLNDLATSTGGLRGQFMLFGVWSGKSAAQQHLTLQWDNPVFIAGQRFLGSTSYRFQDRSNPKTFTMSGMVSNQTKPLADVKDAQYVNAEHEDRFAPSMVDRCDLQVNNLDPNANFEPHPLNDTMYKSTLTNCALLEWEVLGWPSSTLPSTVACRLLVTMTDLEKSVTTTIIDKPVSVAAVQEEIESIDLPTRSTFGPVRVDAKLLQNNTTIAATSYDVLFVPATSSAIRSNNTIADASTGLLCSPGFLIFDDFGKGTQDDTQGWGGPDDQIWALTHDFLELGRGNTDAANRLFTTSGRFCHYTTPWRDLPSGQYFWDWAGGKLEEMVTTGKFKGTKNFRIFLSDRWNGVPINATFTWADFIAFDQYLREQGKSGLSGRSRRQITEEICTKYADIWQRWQMDRYADKLLDVQKRLAQRGVAFSVTTHGSFPLVGDEIGAKLAKTHKASGTDLFWELYNEDLFEAIGRRFGLVAANPDFESGAYGQWSWVSATQSNAHWFGVAGTIEPSRRQWYSTYFAGRVTTSGEFKPYTVFGFDSQGGVGPKNTANETAMYYRTMHFTTRVRPEQPTGVGLVVSWSAQEKRMGSVAGRMGFGLYAANGQDQVDTLAGAVYHRLVENGVPITFVTSTYALRAWKGTTPLVVLDGGSLEPWERDELIRLNKAGTPIIAIGANGSPSTPEFYSFFGVKYANDQWTALPGTRVIDVAGHDMAYTVRKAGSAPVILCPTSGSALNNMEYATICREILAATGNPIQVSPGIALNPFISNNRLFIALNDQGDVNREISVSVRPSLFKADYAGTVFRVIDMDNAQIVPSRWEGDKLTFTLPMAASDGHMVMIVKQ